MPSQLRRAPHEERCPSCRGVGEQRVVNGVDTDDPCYRCHGTGWVPACVMEPLGFPQPSHPLEPPENWPDDV